MNPGAGADMALSALDGSFLRLESAQAHMHVGWTALFASPEGRARPTLEAIQERVAARLDQVPWCRWRLRNRPLTLSEPSWRDDSDFDLDAHVLALTDPEQRVSYAAFAGWRDTLLSRPLDRSRPLWQIFLIPRLEDDRVAIIGKIHHALVDGIAALQIVGLVVDAPPKGPPGERVATRSHHRTRPANRGLQGITSAAGLVIRPAVGGFGLLKAAAAAAGRPHATAGAAARVVGAARRDLLPRAPASALNVPIGPRRTLVGYRASREDLRSARAGGGTLNDIGLAAVAGALRALTLRSGYTPRSPWKAMIPVSMRRAHEVGPGNQISMVYIQLPVHLPSPGERLEWVRAETSLLKSSDRAENMQTLYAAGGLLPSPLRPPVTRAMAAPRVFNLTISQSPGPRGPVHLLGCELQEVYSVVPITDGHALAIGMVRYRQELFIGCYADPDALPQAHRLPALLEGEIRALADAASSADAPAVRGDELRQTRTRLHA